MCNCSLESVVQPCLKLGATHHREVNPLPIVTQRQSWGWNPGLHPSQAAAQLEEVVLQPGGCLAIRGF